MAMNPWNRWLRSSLPALLLPGLTLLITTLAAPGDNRAALCPAGAAQATSSHEGPEPTRASVTLIVDGMLKSRSGAT